MSNINTSLQNPNSTFEILLKDSNLHDVVTDSLQLITEVPTIGTITKAMKFVSALVELNFANKINRFLFELKDIPLEQRQKQIDKINNSSKLAYSIGTVILEQLQRIDMNHKPTMLGKLFASFLNERISFEVYLRLAHIVEQSFIIDLLNFKEFTQNDIYCDKNYNSLIGGDLMTVDYAQTFRRAAAETFRNAAGNRIIEPDGDVDYPQLTELGKIFLENAF